jgi:simple sugar transport system permease protein
MELLLAPFLEATVRTATPLAFAALGELVTERAGVMNLGLEGTIIMGCIAAMLAAQAGGISAGFAVALLAGVCFAALFAWFVVVVRTDHIITGTAFTVLGLGISGTILRATTAGGASTTTGTLGELEIPILSQLPLVGRALFAQPLPTYLLYALVPMMAWWIGRTHGGLSLRAVGERPDAATAAGVAVARVRWLAILFSGAMGGLCGATLVLAQVGSFNEGMSAGRGFIAIAIVALGRWTALGVTGAAAIFGGAFALQYLFQSLALDVPYQLFLALPYLLTLVLLAALRGGARAPESLGS